MAETKPILIAGAGPTGMTAAPELTRFGVPVRLIGSNPPGHPAPGAEPTLADLQAVYDARSEVPARFRDLTWSSHFGINSRMVADLRRGRVCFGGDSAHIHSPAGDRMPDLAVTAGEAGATRLFERLAPDRFTLLLANGADPDRWRTKMEADVTGPWGDLIRVVPIGPAPDAEERRRFLAALGDRPALALIRPDSYVGFLGGEADGPHLAEYLRRWLPGSR